MSSTKHIPEWVNTIARPCYVVCVSGSGNELSVLKGKIYRVLPPYPNDRAHDLRVVDETGEDYLYDADWFYPIDVPHPVAKALEAA